MTQEEVGVQRVRAAVRDRALYFALLYRAFAKTLTSVEVEHLAREAIYEYGRLKGQMDAKPMTPESWVDCHVSSGSAALFESRVTKGEQQSEILMTYCPLMEAWKQLGCSPKEIDILCDIAMEVDRGRADYHRIPYQTAARMARGDPFCRLVLMKPEGA